MLSAFNAIHAGKHGRNHRPKAGLHKTAVGVGADYVERAPAPGSRFPVYALSKRTAIDMARTVPLHSIVSQSSISSGYSCWLEHSKAASAVPIEEQPGWLLVRFSCSVSSSF